MAELLTAQQITALKAAIVEAERTVISNDDAFGEWKF